MPLVGQSFHKNNLSSSSASSSSSSTRVALFTTAFKQNSLQSWSIFRNFNWCTKTKIATIKLNDWLENLIPILTKKDIPGQKKKKSEHHHPVPQIWIWINLKQLWVFGQYLPKKDIFGIK